MKKRILAFLLIGTILLAFTGCGKEPEVVSYQDDMSEHVNLKWYIRCQEPSGFAEVMEEANKYLNDKLNVTLDLVCIQPGDYDQKMQMAFAAQEEFDLVWTANWANKYEPNVTKGAYLELDDLLEQVPQMRDFYADYIWDATRVGDTIYAVPMNQVLYNQGSIYFSKPIVDKHNLDVESVDSLEDVTQIYQLVHDREPDIFVTADSGGYFLSTDLTTDVSSGLHIFNGRVDDLRESREMQWRAMRDWNLRGFFPPDVATLTDKEQLKKAEKIFSGYARYLPGVEGKHKINYGWDIIVVPFTEPFLSRSGVQTTMTAVSRTSKHPVRALKLIELLHTDPYILNLLCYGLEGRDYTKDPDTPNRMVRESGSYYISEFMIGNQFLAYLVPSYEDDVWEETDRMNKTATSDPNIGFSFDTIPVESEIAQLQAVETEFSKILSFGLDDPDNVIPAYDKKLELAGKQKVMDEIQKQYDTWKAAEN